MAKHKGFSLIELLIVVAIVLIIAAIAIPNLLRARMAANDSSAAASIHAIDVAEVSYFGAYNTVGFLLALTPLRGLDTCTPIVDAACRRDESMLAVCGKSGYTFGATGSASAG